MPSSLSLAFAHTQMAEFKKNFKVLNLEEPDVEMKEV